MMSRIPSLIGIALLTALTWFSVTARADVPVSQVTTQSVGVGQSYPEVSAHSEGWFDLGGFCKVIDVGDLSSFGPTADGIPVFIPGSASQWENYRTQSPAQYGGQLTSTTCCRPQTNIATLCANGTNPTSINRSYGRNGETDQVSGVCYDSHGLTFVDTVSLACSGDNGPDGQAAWSESNDAEVCTPNAWTSGCSATCPTTTGTMTTYDSCNNPQSVNACSIRCCTSNYVKTGCEGTTATYTDEGTCNLGSYQEPGGCSLVTLLDSCSRITPDTAGPDTCGCTCGGPGDACGDTHSNDFAAFDCPGMETAYGPTIPCGNQTHIICTYYQ